MTYDPLLDGPGGDPPRGCVGLLLAITAGVLFWVLLGLVVWRAS